MMPNVADDGRSRISGRPRWISGFVLFGPAGTPDPIVRKLNAEFVKALQSDEVREGLAGRKARSSSRGHRRDLAAMVARDIVRLGAIVEGVGARKPE